MSTQERTYYIEFVIYSPKDKTTNDMITFVTNHLEKHTNLCTCFQTSYHKSINDLQYIHISGTWIGNLKEYKHFISELKTENYRVEYYFKGVWYNTPPIQTNMGLLSREEYFKIVAMEAGYNSYEELRKNGLVIDIPFEETNEICR